MQDVLREEAKVRLQASEMSLISSMEYDGESLGKAFAMRHDILIEHRQKGVFVLDTKYKQLTRFEGNEELKATVTKEVSQSDLYQVIEYAANRGLKDAYLLYPMYRYEDEEPQPVHLIRNTVTGDTIRVHIIRLPFVFEDDIDETKRKLTKVIKEIVA